MTGGSGVDGPVQWPGGTLLSALGPQDRRALVASGVRRLFPAGQSLIVEGAVGADTFLLLQGCAKVVCNTRAGRAVLVSVRAAGDLVGELAAADHKPRSASVVAATRVVAQVIAPQVFQAYLDGRPAAARAVHLAVVEELRRSTRYRVSAAGAPAAVRLALVLDQLMTSHGRPCAEGVRIDVPLSQSELASLLGTSQPSVHRLLTDLRRRDVVRTRYRRVVVTDPPALRLLAGDA